MSRRSSDRGSTPLASTKPHFVRPRASSVRGDTSPQVGAFFSSLDPEPFKWFRATGGIPPVVCFRCAGGSLIKGSETLRALFSCLNQLWRARCALQTSRPQPSTQRWARSPSNRGCHSKDTVKFGIETGRAKLYRPAWSLCSPAAESAIR